MPLRLIQQEREDESLTRLRRHVPGLVSFDVATMSGVGHFVMMEDA